MFVSTLTYPNLGRWIAVPFWQRWRNADGKRIRLDSGERLNDDECCCEERLDCTNCLSGTTSVSPTVTISGFVNAPWTSLNGTYALSQVTPCDFTFTTVNTGCGRTGPVCVRLRVGATSLVVGLNSVTGNTSGSTALHGRWRFTKAFPGKADCTGTHDMGEPFFASRLPWPYNVLPCDIVTLDHHTQFQNCSTTLVSEFPRCSLTF